MDYKKCNAVHDIVGDTVQNCVFQNKDNQQSARLVNDVLGVKQAKLKESEPKLSSYYLAFFQIYPNYVT